MFLTLSLIIFLTLFSIFAHEYGHALTAKHVGWKIHGLVFKWYGIGYKVEVNKKNPEDIWKIALGGLIVTLFLCIFFYILSPISIIFYYLFLLNADLLFFNIIIPMKAADGRQIIKGLRLARAKDS